MVRKMSESSTFVHSSGQTLSGQIATASLSGARVSVSDFEGSTAIIKAVPKVARSYSAIAKQRSFAATHGAFRYTEVVPILSLRESANDIIIIQPYISGRSGSDILLGASFQDVVRIRRSFNEYFTKLFISSISAETPSIVFLSKLRQINLSESISLRECARSVESYLTAIGSLEILCGSHHGDFTLNNIIFDGSKLHLFDFSDSYVDSPLQDISKLLLDAKYGLSDRHHSPAHQHQTRLAWHYALPSADEFGKVTHQFAKTLLLFSLFHIFRIYPYTSPGDMITRRWLEATASDLVGQLFQAS